MKLLYIVEDSFQPFRSDVVELFGKQMAERGHKIDWFMQRGFSAEDLNNVYYGWQLDGQPLGNGVHAHQWFNDVLGSTHEICLNVADRYGCADTLCQTVEIVIPAIWTPNAFSPDGDGVNDKYIPRLFDVVPKEHVFQVFNR